MAWQQITPQSFSGWRANVGVTISAYPRKRGGPMYVFIYVTASECPFEALDVMLGDGEQDGMLALRPGNSFRWATGPRSRKKALCLRAWQPITAGKYGPTICRYTIEGGGLTIQLPDWLRKFAPIVAKPVSAVAEAPEMGESLAEAQEAFIAKAVQRAPTDVEFMAWQSIKAKAEADGFRLSDVHDLGRYNKHREGRGQHMLAIKTANRRAA